MKVLFTVFFDCNRVVHHKLLPQGRTVNKESLLCSYVPIVRSNLSETHRIVENPIMDFALLLLREFLVKNKTVIMPQPPY